MDVTPLSLGIETLGGVMTKLIERNTTIPTKKSEVFSTAADSQTQVEIHVLQGERPMATQNRTLGRFHLVGIPPAPRGIPQVEVSFDIDANGIVNVSAKDLGTGKEQKITITSSSGLADDEIKKMVNEAETNSEEDSKQRHLIDLRNQADSLIYSSEKVLNENSEKVPESDATRIRSAIAALKSAVEKGEKSEMEAKIKELTEASHKLAEVIYSSSQQGQDKQQPGYNQAPQSENQSKTDSGDDVVDAEYEESN